MLKLSNELKKRGFIYQISNENVFDLYEKGGESFYCGFDPTADSLHLGNFIGFMSAVHLMRRKNKYIAIIGGATGMIGDPGGKDAERVFLDEKTLRNNEKSIRTQIGNILKNIKNITGEKLEYEVINNYDFFKNMSVLKFLRNVGKYVTVNNMIKKETVRKRIEDPDKSISYTEFSYMLLQGYDFYKLYTDYGVKLQIGGQDQWGNLVTGVELIRKKLDKEAYALTFPLITDANGKKFGKSEGNAIWLDKNKTSSFKLYQFLINTLDEDLEKYLKILTLVEFDEIEKIIRKHMENPEKRYGQKVLAYNVVQIIHGIEEAELAKKLSDFLFGEEDKLYILSKLDEKEISSFVKEVGGKKYENEDILDILVKTKLSLSRGQAKKDIKSGAIYLNEKKVESLEQEIIFVKNISLLRKGKKKYAIIVKK